MLTPSIRCAWSAFLEPHSSQDINGTVLGDLRLLLGGEPKRTLKHLRETDVSAVSQPFADVSLPGIDRKARLLLGGRERFEFGCQPPGRTRLVSMRGLGP